jgi:hypothetical protein
MDKKETLKKIYGNLYTVYCNKNHDYGDSLAKVRNKYNDKFPVILIRLSDKFARLEALLLNGNRQVKDESITDTLLDIANYCAMEVLEMEATNEISKH